MRFQSKKKFMLVNLSTCRFILNRSHELYSNVRAMGSYEQIWFA